MGDVVTVITQRGVDAGDLDDGDKKTGPDDDSKQVQQSPSAPKVKL